MFAFQMSALQQQNAMMRKVKRTLPSPPPDETPVPIVTPAIPHIYTSPGASQRVLPRPVQGAMKAGLLSELKAVEQESTKLRKQQAELEEEEKEIDAKLRCLELGITQRKETRVKDRERQEFVYMRYMGDARDYMSDSELNNLRLAGVAPGTYEENGMLSRPRTAPLNQYTTDLNASPYPPTSSYVPYQYPQPQPQPTPTQHPLSPISRLGFRQHHTQPPHSPSLEPSNLILLNHYPIRPQGHTRLIAMVSLLMSLNLVCSSPVTRDSNHPLHLCQGRPYLILHRACPSNPMQICFLPIEGQGKPLLLILNRSYPQTMKLSVILQFK